MTAATITLTPVAAPAAHLRRRVRAAGARVLDFMGKAYAPPAGTPDDEIWRYYYALPMY
jgi:hypothetical protein